MRISVFLIGLLAGLVGCGREEPREAVKPTEQLPASGEHIDGNEKAQATALASIADPIVQEIVGFRGSVRDSLVAGNFDELDRQAEELRTSKALFANGSWKLTQFYTAFEGNDNEPASRWEALDKKHREWIAAKPDSITARVAYATFLADYAWYARGSGFANTVTQEGGRLFGERLEAAGKELEAGAALPQKDAYWFRILMRVGLGQGWTPKDFDELTNDALAFEPTFWGYDVARANSLLPRWYGNPGDWEAFAEKSAQRPGGLGAEVYARIVISQLGYFENIFRESRASWPRTKEGLDILRKKYPDSLEILSQAALLGTMAQDQPYAKAAFAALGDRYVRGIWPSRQSFVHYRNWARTGRW
jgi:hypothetical protein